MTSSYVTAIIASMKRMPGIKDFEKGLDDMLAEARRAGHRVVRVVSLDLHNKVFGPLPRDGNHRMPTACNAMWKLQKRIGGKVLSSPPESRGTTLKIEYPL